MSQSELRGPCLPPQPLDDKEKAKTKNKLVIAFSGSPKAGAPRGDKCVCFSGCWRKHVTEASATLAVEITQDGLKEVMFLKHVAGEGSCMDHLVSRSSRFLRVLKRN